jgi:hypothetical protein
VQKADSLSLFDELDAASRSDPSKGRIAMRRAIDLSPSEADGSRDFGNLTVSSILPAITKREYRNLTPQGGFGASKAGWQERCYPF